jgi:hypothetical protein
MERVIVNTGTKTNLYQLFEDLQTYVHTNFSNVVGELVEEYGIVASTLTNGSISDDDPTLLVTTDIGDDTIHVGPGSAIVNGFKYINYPGGDITLSGLSNGIHLLYLKYKYSYDTPVDYMSGFAYALPDLTPGLNSRAHNSYELIWDISTDSVVLSTVEVTDGLVSAYEDMRNSNVFRLNAFFIGDNDLVRTNQTSVQSLTNGLTMPVLNLENDITNNPYISYLVSGISELQLTLSTMLDMVGKSHSQNTDTGTTSWTFTVGNKTAELEPDEPPYPLNLRLVDVFPPTLSAVRSKESEADLADSVRTGLISHEAAVKLKWGYDNIIGYSPSENVFNVSYFGNLSGMEGIFVGYYLYLPSAGTSWKILSHVDMSTYAQLTVEPVNNGPTLDGETADINNPGIIHCGCDSYELVVVPYNNTTPDYSERYEQIISWRPYGNTGPVIQEVIENLFLGERVSIRMRAVSGRKSSAYAEMQSGLYTKLPPYETTQRYVTPWYVSLPRISSIGASVGATATTTGFTVNIVGWDVATDFEICYTTDSAGPDYTNSTHEKFTSRQRSIDISTSSSHIYYIAARPLMSGQAVANPIRTTVRSGSGINPPREMSIGPITVNFKTYTGDLGLVDLATGMYEAINVESPWGSGNATLLADDVVGKILDLGTANYTIINIFKTNTQTKIQVVDSLGNYPASSLDGASFIIGTTKAGRLLQQINNITTDIQLTRMSAMVYSLGAKASNAVLRWYQASREIDADSVAIGTAGPVTKDTDIAVLSLYGDRTLYVDLWDPSETDNTGNFYASITFFWKPYEATGRGIGSYTMPTVSEQISSIYSGV